MIQYKYTFSIVMTVYDTESHLLEAIQSLLEQTIGFEQNVQLILVADNSLSSSRDICNSFIKKYPKNILLLHTINDCMLTAFNENLSSIITGKYINFTDSNCIFSDNTLEEVFSFFEKNYEKIDIVSVRETTFDGKTSEYSHNVKTGENSCIINLMEEYEKPQISAPSIFIKNSEADCIQLDMITDKVLIQNICQSILSIKMRLGMVKSGSCQRIMSSQRENLLLQKSGNACCVRNIGLLWNDIYSPIYKRYGNIPRFIQCSILRDLQKIIKDDLKESKLYITDLEIDNLKRDLFNILSFINDEVVLNQKNLSVEHKCFFLTKKYGVQPVHYKYCKDLAVIVRDNCIILESQFKMSLDFMRIDDNRLILEGRVYTLVSTKISDLEIYLRVNEELLLCKVFDLDLKEVYCLDSPIKYAWRFIGEITDFKELTKFNIKIVVRFKGILIEKKSVDLGKYFPLTKGIKNAYASFGGYIFTCSGNTINVVKSNLKNHIKHELLFLKQLKNINTQQSKKAIAARCFYYIAKMFKRDKWWLLSDRINKADDNAEALFKYLREQNVAETLFFVIKKDSLGYKTVKQYGKVLEHFSLKHKLFHLLADIIVSSSGDAYVTNPYGTSRKYYQDILVKQKRVFLQHGIIKDDLSGWLNKYNKNFDIFITSAIPEYNSILLYPYYYDENVVQLTGLPRYDRLFNNKKKIITIMPTWRDKLSDQARIKEYSNDGLRRYTSEFKETKYFKFYNSLINNKRLLLEIKKYGYCLQFMPHPNLIAYIDWFTKNENVKFCSIDTEYRSVFAESALIVTDYSSVAFDFAYLRKPVVYCQFDKDEILSNHFYGKGYFDYEKDGFGEVTYDMEKLIDCIVEYMKNNCELKEKYRRKINKFFAFNDKNNCQRVYQVIKLLE